MEIIGMKLGDAIVILKEKRQRFVVNEAPPSPQYVKIVVSDNKVDSVVGYNEAMGYNVPFRHTITYSFE